MSRQMRSSGKRAVKKSQDGTQQQQRKSLASSSTDSVSTLEWVTPQPQDSQTSEFGDTNLDFESFDDLDDLISTLRNARNERGEPWDGDDMDEEEDEDSEYGDYSDEELQLVPVTPDSTRDSQRVRAQEAQQSGNVLGASGALVPVQENDDDEEDVDSDEERSIMKEIRQEIQDQVRGEMKSEIEMYRAKVAALENGRFPDDDKSRSSTSAEEEMDPKVKAALIKMRKLDKILKKRVVREKEVKRERILLERRIRDEIKQLKPVGRETRDMKTNTSKFLSLTVPIKHNEDVAEEMHLGIVVTEEPHVDPFFQTQIDHDVLRERRRRGKERRGSTEGSEGDAASQVGSAAGESTLSQENSSRRSSLGDKKGGRRRSKNFIKRNIELASKADETIAMTEEEKKRLLGLLSDLEAIPDATDENSSNITGSEENPYQVVLKCGEGFLPDVPQQESLCRIDSQLRELASTEDFASICSTPVEPIHEHKLFTRVMVRSALDIERYGEKALIETKEERDMHDRLKSIEKELSKFNNPDEVELDTPDILSEAEMKDLVDHCVQSLSRSASVTTACTDQSELSDEEAQLSSRLSFLEHPPHLSEETLQKLLSEAHFPLSKKLAALKEEEEDGEESSSGAIQAETWKAIAEASADDEERQPQSAQSFHPSQQFHRQLSRSSLRSGGDAEYVEPALSESDHFHAESDRWARERLVLPEISRSPYLVSQGLNNLSRPESRDRPVSRDRPAASDRSSIDMIHNDLGDSQMRLSDSDWTPECSVSVSGDQTMVPHPPSNRERRSASGQSAASARSTPVTCWPET